MINMYKKNILLNIFISFLLFSILLTSFMYIVDALDKQNKYLDEKYVLEKFSNFQAEIDSQIIESIALLEGYLSFLETKENASEEDTINYLDNLLLDKITLIRNISILEDTTIKWVFPKEGNEGAIGLNLFSIPSQKNDLLRVKNNLERIIVGPIELVQGGKGFIARIPIIKQGQYWGQASIVFDADKYLQYIDEKSKESKLSIALFTQDNYPHNPFYGDSIITEQEGMVLNMHILDSEWIVVATPIDGWRSFNDVRRYFEYLMVIISGAISVLLYVLLNSRHKLMITTHTDVLTGLANRHQLNHFISQLNKNHISNYCIYIIDVNNLKQINDKHGHKIGDLVLKSFANQIKQVVDHHIYAYRLGGDEFMLISKDFTKEEYIKQYHKLEDLINYKFTHENIHINISAEIGMANSQEDGNTIKQLGKVADYKMYQNKSLKKNKTDK